MKIDIKWDYVAYLIVILLLLYGIWFVTQHSEPVSFADLMTFGGVLIGGAGILFSLIFGRLDKLENKVDDILKEVHHIKGRLETEEYKTL